jgi:hypothetical protein
MSGTDVHGTVADGTAFWADVPGPHSSMGIGYGLDSTPPLDQVASEAFADPRGGIALGHPRRRFGFGCSYPEHDRLTAAVHRAATAS